MYWELDNVEGPFVEQLISRGMDWSHITGDLVLPVKTGRACARIS